MMYLGVESLVWWQEFGLVVFGGALIAIAAHVWLLGRKMKRANQQYRAMTAKLIEGKQKRETYGRSTNQ